MTSIDIYNKSMEWGLHESHVIALHTTPVTLVARGGWACMVQIRKEDVRGWSD